jgi:hypothetical protein
MSCLNINDPSVKELISYYGGLAEASSAVTLWQKQYDTDEVPSLTDLLSDSFVTAPSAEVKTTLPESKVLESRELTSERFKDLPNEYIASRTKISNEALTNILDNLKSKFGIDYVVDSTLQSKGAFKNGKVYINPNKFTLDTPFHEFAHPFLMYIKKTNSGLYNELLNEIKKDTLLLNTIKKKYSELSETEQLDEAVVTKMGNLAGKLSTQPAYKSIFDRILDAISKFISKLTNKQVTLKLNTSIHQLATMLVDETQLPLELMDFEEGEFLSKNDTDSFNNAKEFFTERNFENIDIALRIAKANGINTTLAEDTLHKVYKVASRVEPYEAGPDEEASRYSVDGDTTFKGVTDWIEDFAEEGTIKIFKGDPSESPGVKYGNAADYILDMVVQSYDYTDDYKLSDTYSLSDMQSIIAEDFDIELSTKEISHLANQIVALLKANPNSIFLSQMSIFNASHKVVGTTDLLAIDMETGAVKIIDLKLSAKSVTADSKKLNRYKYQVSTYGAMYKSRSIPVSGLSIYEIQRYDDEEKRFGYGKEVPISPLKNVEEHFNVFNDPNENRQNKKLINKVKVIIQKELNKARKNKNAYGLKKYKDLQEALTNISIGESVVNFVKSAHLDIIGKVYVQNGVHKISTKYSDKGKFETLKSDYESGTIDNKTYIEELYKIKKDLELYQPILIELLAISKEMERSDDSTGQELVNAINEIIQFKKQFTDEYKDAIMPVYADELLKNLDLNKLNAQHSNNLRILEQRLQEHKTSGNKAAEEKVQKDIDALKASTPTKEGLIKMLEEGFDKDLSYFKTSLVSTINSHNDIISLYVLKVKTYYENINQKIFAAQPVFDKEYASFTQSNRVSNDSKKDYNLFFEQSLFSSDGGWNEESHFEDYGYTRDRNYKGWMQSFSELNKKSDEMRDDDSVDRAEINDLRKEWFLTHCEPLAENNTTVYNEALGKEVVLEYGTEYLLNEVLKDKILKAGQDVEKGTKDFNQWLVNRSVELANGQVMIMDVRFVKPAKTLYRNDKYELLKNSSAFKYYQFSLSTVLGTRTSNRYNIDYRLPSVPATDLTKAKDSGVVNFVKDQYSQLTKSSAEEQIEYGDSLIIGDAYSKKLEDKDRTFDITEITRMFYKEGLVRKTRRDLELFSLGLLDAVGETEVTRTRGDKSIVDRAKQQLLEAGLDIDATETISGKESNVYKVLNELIETLVYGRTREGNDTLNTITRNLAKLASVTQLGGLNVVPAIAQNLQQSTMAAVEAWAGTNLSKESLLWARTKETSIIADLSNDITGSGTKKSLIGQLLQVYNVFQGDFYDEFGRKISGKHFANMMQSSPAFFLQKVANQMPIIRSFLAYLKDTKIQDENGITMSLFDAYTLDKNSRLVLKPNVKIKNYGDFDSQIVDGAAMKKFHGIVKGMGESKGLINNPLIKRKWYGNALLFYRNWVVPGLLKRFDTLNYDKEQEDYTIGSYRQFWKTLWAKDFNKVWSAIIKNKENLTDYEYAALRHAFFEQSAILLTSLLGIILAGMVESADDDEEKKRLQYALYFTQRLNTEISFFGGLGNVDTAGLPNVSDTLRMFKQPTFLSSYVLNTSKLLYQITNPFEQYERDYGMFEKGDYKIAARFLKLFGISGTQMHPEDLLKILTLSTAS